VRAERERARGRPSAAWPSGPISASCAPGDHTADVAVRTARGQWLAPVRVSRCGDPEPVALDTTGRAVFVRANGGLRAWSSAPVQRYARPHTREGPQRSGR
jgi:hypothetical protein